MPQLGDRCHGFDIGKKNRDIYIWEECPNCVSPFKLFVANFTYYLHLIYLQ